MNGDKLTKARRIIAILSGKLDRAERALADVLAEIRAVSEALHRRGVDLGAPAIDGASDPAFVIFAERRRALLNQEVAALMARLSALEAVKEKRRQAVASLLRQTTSLANSADAAEADLRRKRERK